MALFDMGFACWCSKGISLMGHLCGVVGRPGVGVVGGGPPIMRGVLGLCGTSGTGELGYPRNKWSWLVAWELACSFGDLVQPGNLLGFYIYQWSS